MEPNKTTAKNVWPLPVIPSMPLTLFLKLNYDNPKNFAVVVPSSTCASYCVDLGGLCSKLSVFFANLLLIYVRLWAG